MNTKVQKLISKYDSGEHVGDYFDQGTWDVLDSFYKDHLEINQDDNDPNPEVNAWKEVKTFHPDYTFDGDELNLETRDLWVRDKREKLESEKLIKNGSSVNKNSGMEM